MRAAGADRISVTLNPASVSPLDPTSAADAAAVQLVDGLQNRIFLDPMLRGRYPADMLAHMRRFSDLAWLRDGDEELIAAPIDILGINYYAPEYVAARPGAPGGGGKYPGTEGVEFVGATGPVTDMGWQIEPSGLTRLLTRLGQDYPETPLLITENGAAFPDGPQGDPGRVTDHNRVSYLDGHLRACHDAISRGVDLRGYYVWSLMDNFEWAEGYRRRFGIVHVDYTTQRRVLKDSARWYQEVIRRNGLTTDGHTKE